MNNIFGVHQNNTIEQFREVEKRSLKAALLADGHFGYGYPVGGITAYDNEISLQGVGVDISCLAKGTLITTGDGYYIPIENIKENDNVVSSYLDQRIFPNHSNVLNNGLKNIMRVTFEDGRVLECTPEHKIYTKSGWECAEHLTLSSECVASPYIGLPYSEYSLPDVLKNSFLGDRLSTDPALLAAFLRLFGSILADGHLTKTKYSLIWYAYFFEDGEAIRRDISKLRGDKYSEYSRRHEPASTEYSFQFGDKKWQELFVALGSPRGKKTGNWDLSKLDWVLDQPLWAQSQLVDGFSKDMTTPHVLESGRPGSVVFTQSSIDDSLITWWKNILLNLGIISQVGIHYNDEDSKYIAYRLQINGGTYGLRRLCQIIPFTYSIRRREGAAKISSVINIHQRLRSPRLLAHAAALIRKGTKPVRQLKKEISEEFGVSPAFVHHAMYGRNLPRVMNKIEVDSSNEVYFIRPTKIELLNDQIEVFDIQMNHESHNFIANGIVVHNCGNCAIKTDITVDSIQERLPEIADEFSNTFSFGVGRTNIANKDAPINDILFDDNDWIRIKDRIGQHELDSLKAKARNQITTIGGGNHYLDLFSDEDGIIWIGNHFGSRGFGHTLAMGFMNLAQGFTWGDRTPEKDVYLSLGDSLGDDYWALLQLAGRYAYLGREWVARKAVNLIGGKEIEMVHNNHNAAFKEKHMIDGVERDLIVVRKGSTPAFPGQKGFVGGSMGDISVILEGYSGDDVEIQALQDTMLYSTVHGAGRIMSRTEANGKRHRKTGDLKINAETGLPSKAPKVTGEMMTEWVKKMGVILRGPTVFTDESPQCYRPLKDVLAAQGETINILHILQPLIVVMAPDGIVDPYK